MSEVPGLQLGATGGSQPVETGGNENVGWVADLPEDDRTWVEKAGYKDLPSLIKSHRSLESKLGKTVQLPGDDATAEQRREFFRKLGMPESKDGYELPKPGDLPPNVKLDDTFTEDFKALAHESELTTKQARQLYDWYNKRKVEQAQSQIQQGQESIKKTEDMMRKEWGERYDAEYTLTMRAVDKFGGEELKQFFNGTGLGNHPTMVKAFNQIAHAVGEDNLVGGEELGAAPQHEKGVLDYPSMKDLKPLSD